MVRIVMHVESMSSIWQAADNHRRARTNAYSRGWILKQKCDLTNLEQEAAQEKVLLRPS